MIELSRRLARLSDADMTIAHMEWVLADLTKEDFDLGIYTQFTSRGYQRIPLFNNGVGVYLQKWPRHGVSSIHEHTTYRGLIKVLSGTILENQYQYDDYNGSLRLIGRDHWSEGAIIQELPQSVHQVINDAGQMDVVTLHMSFKNPKGLRGNRIFNPSTGEVAVLSKRAYSFSWEQDSSCFEKVLKNACHLC